MTDETRSHAHEIEIATTPERAWQALIDPDDLTSWYVERAEVEAREGGRFWVSWGEGMDGVGRIDVFDPPHRLRVVHQPPEDPDPAMPVPELDEPIVDEFVVDAKGPDGPVVVRMVNSGIPRTAEWDGFYDGTRRGWEAYMHWLRHYLEEHPGEQRRGPQVMAPVDDADKAWDTLLDALGLDDGHGAGDTIETAGGPGDRFAGQVLMAEPHTTLVRTTAPDDGMLYLSVEQSPEAAFAVVGMSGYGWSRAQTDEATARWTSWAHQTLGIS